jgi:hypothetical protein
VGEASGQAGDVLVVEPQHVEVAALGEVGPESGIVHGNQRIRRSPRGDRPAQRPLRGIEALGIGDQLGFMLRVAQP